MKEYYSDCCCAYMHDYPDSDICPSCKEHCGGLTEDEIEAEEGDKGRLLK